MKTELEKSENAPQVMVIKTNRVRYLVTEISIHIFTYSALNWSNWQSTAKTLKNKPRHAGIA